MIVQPEVPHFVRCIRSRRLYRIYNLLVYDQQKRWLAQFSFKLPAVQCPLRARQRQRCGLQCRVTVFMVVHGYIINTSCITILFRLYFRNRMKHFIYALFLDLFCCQKSCDYVIHHQDSDVPFVYYDAEWRCCHANVRPGDVQNVERWDGNCRVLRSAARLSPARHGRFLRVWTAISFQISPNLPVCTVYTDCDSISEHRLMRLSHMAPCNS